MRFDSPWKQDSERLEDKGIDLWSSPFVQKGELHRKLSLGGARFRATSSDIPAVFTETSTPARTRRYGGKKLP